MRRNCQQQHIRNNKCFKINGSARCFYCSRSHKEGKWKQQQHTSIMLVSCCSIMPIVARLKRYSLKRLLYPPLLRAVVASCWRYLKCRCRNTTSRFSQLYRRIIGVKVWSAPSTCGSQSFAYLLLLLRANKHAFHDPVCRVFCKGGLINYHKVVHSISCESTHCAHSTLFINVRIAARKHLRVSDILAPNPLLSHLFILPL